MAFLLQDSNSISISLGGGREISLLSREYELPLDVCSLHCASQQPACELHDVPHIHDVEFSPATNVKSEYLHDSVTKEDALLGIEKVIQYINCVKVQPYVHRNDIELLGKIHESISQDTINTDAVPDFGDTTVRQSEPDKHDNNTNVVDEVTLSENTDSDMTKLLPCSQDASVFLVDTGFDELSKNNTVVTNNEGELAFVMNTSLEETEGTAKIVLKPKKPKKYFGRKRLQCYECNKWFAKRATLEGHICKSAAKQLQLTSGLKQIIGRKRLQCSECSKTFEKGSTLTAHLRMHAGLPAFKCTLCDKEYNTIVGYKTHMHKHSDKVFQCEKCGKYFKTPSNLYTHMRTHDEVKRYVCPVCGKRSATSCHNLQHMKIHTNDRKYKCDVCDKAFITSSDLRRHKRIH